MKKFTFEMWLNRSIRSKNLGTITVESKTENDAREKAYADLTQNVDLELTKEK